MHVPAQESVEEWQEEEEVQVDLSDLNIKELPQPEERAAAAQTLDADGNPTGPGQAGVWNRNKDKGEGREANFAVVCSALPKVENCMCSLHHLCRIGSHIQQQACFPATSLLSWMDSLVGSR